MERAEQDQKARCKKEPTKAVGQWPIGEQSKERAIGTKSVKTSKIQWHPVGTVELRVRRSVRISGSVNAKAPSCEKIVTEPEIQSGSGHCRRSKATRISGSGQSPLLWKHNKPISQECSNTGLKREKGSTGRSLSGCYKQPSSQQEIECIESKQRRQLQVATVAPEQQPN